MFKEMFSELFGHRATAQEKAEAVQEFGQKLSIDEEFAQYAASLEVKRKAAIERMGEKWVLHPSHHVKKNDKPENTLGFKTA